MTKDISGMNFQLHADSEISESTEKISYFEIRDMVSSLQPVSVRDVGSSQWTSIHQTMSKLNLKAHAQVQDEVEESIVSEIIKQDKIKCLVHHLLAIETWKINVFPFLKDDFANHDNIRAYFMLYHEATAINLLELILFRKDAVESLGDAQVDLIDYCARKIQALNLWYDISKLTE